MESASNALTARLRQISSLFSPEILFNYMASKFITMISFYL